MHTCIHLLHITHACIHTCIYTYIHTCMYTYIMHTHIQTTHIYACIHTLMYTYIHTYICMYTHTLVYAYMHVYIDLWTLTDTFTHTCTYKHPHINVHTHITTHAAQKMAWFSTSGSTPTRRHVEPATVLVLACAYSPTHLRPVYTFGGNTCHSTFSHVNSWCNRELPFIPLIWRMAACWTFKISDAVHNAVWPCTTVNRL